MGCREHRCGRQARVRRAPSGRTLAREPRAPRGRHHGDGPRGRAPTLDSAGLGGDGPVVLAPAGGGDPRSPRVVDVSRAAPDRGRSARPRMWCSSDPDDPRTRPSSRPPGLPARPITFARRLASAVPTIHAIDSERARRTVPPSRPYYGRAQSRPPVWARTPALWERAIDRATRDASGVPTCFIHRDYHPGNTLWIADRLTAIVDRTTASFGPPSVDVSHVRATLAMSCDGPCRRGPRSCASALRRGRARSDRLTTDVRRVSPADRWTDP